MIKFIILHCTLVVAGCTITPPVERVVLDRLVSGAGTYWVVPVVPVGLRIEKSIRLAAFATPPDQITLTTGMLEYAEGGELAFVMAHELTHLIRGHRDDIGRQPQYEREADIIGLCIMQAVGYNNSAGVSLLTKFRTTFPGDMDDRLQFLSTTDLEDYC